MIVSHESQLADLLIQDDYGLPGLKIIFKVHY